VPERFGKKANVIRKDARSLINEGTATLSNKGSCMRTASHLEKLNQNARKSV
jgi:hypothetical protein